MEFTSTLVTLEPGDIISTGYTPQVLGTPDQKLVDGDVVEVEIEKIGVLRNPVVSGNDESISAHCEEIVQ